MAIQEHHWIATGATVSALVAAASVMYWAISAVDKVNSTAVAQDNFKMAVFQRLDRIESKLENLPALNEKVLEAERARTEASAIREAQANHLSVLDARVAGLVEDVNVLTKTMNASPTSHGR